MRTRVFDLTAQLEAALKRISELEGELAVTQANLGATQERNARLLTHLRTQPAPEPAPSGPPPVYHIAPPDPVKADKAEASMAKHEKEAAR